MEAYVRSPLNYIGGKYNLLSQILPFFPTDAKTCVDLFCGGGNVAVNMPIPDDGLVVMNDQNFFVVDILQAFSERSIQEILFRIDQNIANYNLSKENEEGFVAFRKYYNSSTKDPIDLYTLLCFSFNNQPRFNSKHDYNSSFGRNRSSFNNAMRANLINFVEKLHERDVLFSKLDFSYFPTENLSKGDFIYCDPPYLITTAVYNERRGPSRGWTEKDEFKLLAFLDKLDSSGLRFALSNVLYHKGQTNIILDNWRHKYNTHEMNFNYSNASYNLKDTAKSSQSLEVLITNY